MHKIAFSAEALNWDDGRLFLAVARAGQILVTESTMAAVDHFVDGKQVDEISLKGVSRPIKIYEIVPPPA